RGEFCELWRHHAKVEVARYSFFHCCEKCTILIVR
uniref:Uncharacterized protein n=1 Tax=Ciona savignyi TaxID=51511 RepID=H2ZDR9_CIOSA